MEDNFFENLDISQIDDITSEIKISSYEDFKRKLLENTDTAKKDLEESANATALTVDGYLKILDTRITDVTQNTNIIFYVLIKFYEAVTGKRRNYNYEDYLDTLTPAKVKEAFPERDLSEDALKLFSYTEEEKAAINEGGEPAAKAKINLKARKTIFLSNLTGSELITLYAADKETPQEESTNEPVAALDNFKTSRVDSFISSNDFISQIIFDAAYKNGKPLELQSNEPRRVIVGHKNKKPVTTLVSINYDALEDVKGEKKLLPEDREVHDAVLSNYLAENEVMTYGMIFNAMTGKNKDTADLTEEQFRLIDNSITKLLYTPLKLNNKDQAEKYGYSEMPYDGPIIQGERVKAKINGHQAEAVLRINRIPVLYQFADNAGGQIVRIPSALLDTPISKNRESIILQGYLFRRISAIKAGSLTNKILYETIYRNTIYRNIKADADTPAALRKKKAKIRGKIKKILDFWTERDFISGYVELEKTDTPIKPAQKGESKSTKEARAIQIYFKASPEK